MIVVPFETIENKNNLLQAIVPQTATVLGVQVLSSDPDIELLALWPESGETAYVFQVPLVLGCCRQPGQEQCLRDHPSITAELQNSTARDRLAA